MVDWELIDTVFLDAGNTLLTMDYAAIAAVLGEHGLKCTAEQLARAEAAARPAVSARVHAGGSTESKDTFTRYLEIVLTSLPEARAGKAIPSILPELVGAIHRRGRNHELWCRQIPGTRAALERMRDHGLRLVVVSNSDGTVARSLTASGLDGLVSEVIDSHLAGYEKPDPRLFTHALDRVGAEPSRTLHVGDLYHVDVLGARAAGILGVLVDPYGDWRELDCPVFPDVGALADKLIAARRN